MFEGQNIHLSPVDGKRLCSFSQKICKQHRLNGFAFCIRHILEDKNAPFKQCEYKTKANGERCFNPVPEAADRVYCSSHLQVLGMIPKNPSKQCPDKRRTTVRSRSRKGNSVGNKKHAQSAADKDPCVQKISQNAKKILEEDYAKEAKVTNWYAVMTKLFKKTAYNLHTWQKQRLDTEVSDLLKTRVYQKQNQSFFRVHVIDDDDIQSDDGSSDVFQSILLDSNERVHHNLLRVESPATQEEKMLSKLKHRNGQLRQVLDCNMKGNGLSYSVLSTLVSSARKSAVQTANVLNVESGATSYGDFPLHRKKEDAISYQVPCAMLSSDVCCTKMALPYTKYCRDHVSMDSDQYLFSSDTSFDIVNDPIQSFHFIHGGEVPSVSTSSSSSSTLVPPSASNQCKRKGDTSPASQSKRSHQKIKPNVEEKRLKKKKSKTKKKPSKRPVNSMREELQKKFDIPAQPTQKLNAHIKKAMLMANSIPVNSAKNTTVEETPEVLIKQREEILTNSNSEEEDDADILTPEEAFHLPPGSLSFSPRMVDDDSLPAIQNRNCSLDDEDDELIRCSSNFPFDPNNQLPRDIGSPTLNQLSSSDFTSSFNNINNIFMSPAKTLDPPPPPLNTNKATFQQSFNTPVCRPNNPTNHNVNNRLTHSNQPVPGMLNEQKSGSTLLKISHVDMFNKASVKIEHNTMYAPKQIQDDRNIRGNSFNSISGGAHDNKMMLQYRNNGMAPMNNQQIPVGNEPINTYSHLANGIVNRSHNIPIKETIGYDQSLSKRYLSDPLLLQQPLSQDNTLFDDINTDVESPLEKVNPDIFFSSVFPVSTSTGSI